MPAWTAIMPSSPGCSAKSFTLGLFCQILYSLEYQILQGKYTSIMLWMKNIKTSLEKHETFGLQNTRQSTYSAPLLVSSSYLPYICPATVTDEQILAVLGQARRHQLDAGSP